MSQDQSAASGSSPSTRDADYQALSQSLQSLGTLAFPLVCIRCGKTYETLSELVQATQQPLRTGGPGQGTAGTPSQATEFARRCVCGGDVRSTFENRRDRSPEGLRQRENFGQLLDKLKAAGVPVEEARQELFKVMRGEPTPILLKLLQP